jgi:hypothetical protein
MVLEGGYSCLDQHIDLRWMISMSVSVVFVPPIRADLIGKKDKRSTNQVSRESRWDTFRSFEGYRPLWRHVPCIRMRLTYPDNPKDVGFDLFKCRNLFSFFPELQKITSSLVGSTSIIFFMSIVLNRIAVRT